jgi:hypothetical protein
LRVKSVAQQTTGTSGGQVDEIDKVYLMTSGDQSLGDLPGRAVVPGAN